MGWAEEYEPWERLALAQGITAAQTGLPIPEAVEVMNDRSFIEGCTLAELAVRVLEGSIRFDGPND